jgi:anhydro-N-acetylmuramic acid kinase
MLAIGLMSGTSLDGIDAAIVETDGDGVTAFGKSISIPYPDDFRDTLRQLLGMHPNDFSNIQSVVDELTERHAEAVHTLLDQAGLSADQIDVIGFHGQTLFHDPDNAITCQIGNGDMLAKMTGIAVIDDFRSNDVASGGEGAPLAPAYHVALARTLERPVAFLNIGGVANLTWISPDGGAIAFDTGPGNALMDDWVLRHTGTAMDTDGALARSGTVDQSMLQELLSNDYFAKTYPKSLDRDQFDVSTLKDLSVEDGTATLCAFTASAVAKAADLLPAKPLRWLVCGGGRHNMSVMAALRRSLDAPVEPVEAEGFDGDALEAQAFAYLAIRSLKGLPISYPQTTGVDLPTTGGVFHEP